MTTMRIFTALLRLAARPELSMVTVVAAALLSAGCSADSEMASGAMSAGSGGGGETEGEGGKG